jgi:hypothetical protein
LKVNPASADISYIRGYAYFRIGQVGLELDDLKRVAKMNEDLLKLKMGIVFANKDKYQLSHLKFLRGIT